jgi:NAD(P)-dependent dehydrogenase (short-subunit alcohol dehydrogenase family)
VLLDGKSLLITGAGAGIGRATALLAAREGARLVVADCDAAAAESTAELVRAAGGQASACRADIAISEDVTAMVKHAVTVHGRLDIAFNNAGTSSSRAQAQGRRIGEISEDAWNRIIGTNLTGTWLCMKAEISCMESYGGAIVNTASISGLTGAALSGAYVASKHGLIGLTKSAAIEYAVAGIRINCLCPGFTDTTFLPTEHRSSGSPALARIPQGRLGRPEEIAEMAVWLLSDRASYVTGATVTVDGGVLAG